MSSPHTIVVTTAAHILGRAGADAVAHSDALLQALQDQLHRWRECWSQLRLRNAPELDDLGELTECVTQLLWASGQLQIGAALLWQVVQGQLADEHCYAADVPFRPLQIAALQALAQLPSLEPAVLQEITDSLRRAMQPCVA